MNAASRTIELGDLEVHYLEAGDGPPLVLRHGGLATAEMSWDNAMPELAAHYRVLAPDTRGHGRTNNPAQTLSYAQFADDTAAFVAALGLDRPYIFGYSDGAQTAIEIGLRHPGLAGALVFGGAVTEPFPEYIENLHNWGFTSPGEVDLDRLAQEFGGFFEQIKVAHGQTAGPDYWRGFLKQISTLWLTVPSYTDAQLASIATPSLTIMGDRDSLGGLQQAERLYRKVSAGELAIVPNAGHDAVNRPVFWTLVLDFLSRRDDARSSNS